MKRRRSSRPRPAAATVHVPGTTANLGSGFDALAIALGLSNRCRLRRIAGNRLVWSGASASAQAMMRKAAAAFFKKAHRRPFGFSLEVGGQVPVARGLGSSVTVRLGITAGLNRLCGSPLDREQLLDLVASLEGHPDNAAAAVCGGLVVSATEAGEVRHVQLHVDRSLKFLLIIPDFEIETGRARKVLPRSYSRADAVHNLGRACLLTAALATRCYDVLWCATDDRLHQPYRARLLRPLHPVLRAAKRAGALGGWLSGSGSTICVLAHGGTEKILRAIRRAMPRSMRWSHRAVRADNRGFRVH
jgi:homoserine kinase